MYLTRYLKCYPCPDKPERVVLAATRSCMMLECPASLWDKICNDDQISQQEQSALMRLGVLVADRDIEVEEMRVSFASTTTSNHHLSVTVTLTEEHNLACSYHHKDPSSESLFMFSDTADLLVQRLTERISAGFDVSMDFRGGETLLRLELLAGITGSLAEAARTHGVHFSFRLFTDGILLTPHVVQRLLPLGLSLVHLTIDGPPDIHNMQRPFVAGGASFSGILTNLREVYQLVPVELGGNYTRETYRRFTELLDLLSEEGIEPSRLEEICFSPITPGVDGAIECLDSACACTAEPWTSEAALFLRQESIRRGFPVALIKPGARMIYSANDLAVGIDGSIYRCPVLMGREEMRVGCLADEMVIPPPLGVRKNSICLECVYFPLCFGGCRFFRTPGTGVMQGGDCRRTFLHASLEQFLGLDQESGKC